MFYTALLAIIQNLMVVDRNEGESGWLWSKDKGQQAGSSVNQWT